MDHPKATGRAADSREIRQLLLLAVCAVATEPSRWRGWGWGLGRPLDFISQKRAKGAAGVCETVSAVQLRLSGLLTQGRIAAKLAENGWP